MECKSCGTPCPDEAVYCGSCGSRLDGKKLCSVCGKLVDGESAYCIYCGSRLDGKHICGSCGEVYEGNFCPVCGMGALAQKKAVKTGAKTKNTKWASFLTGGVAMLGVLFALIFVFLIGVKSGIAGRVESESETLFYYFGDFYKELKATDFSELAEIDFIVQYIEKESLAIGIFGTVISALSLLCVCVFAIVSVVIYVRNLLGYTQKRAGGWAVATMLAYIVGATAFVGLHNTSVPSSGIIEFSNLITYNGATKAGIVLCAIFLGVYFVCRFIENALQKGKSLLTKNFVLATALSVIGVAFASVVFGVMKNAGFTIKVTADETTVETLMSFPLANVEILSMFGVLVENDTTYTLISQEMYWTCFSNTVAEICLLLTLVFAGICIGANLKGVVGKEKFWAIATSVLCVVCSVICLVENASAWKHVQEAFAYAKPFSPDILETSFAKPICAVVFSTLLLIISVIGGCMKKRKWAEE